MGMQQDTDIMAFRIENMVLVRSGEKVMITARVNSASSGSGYPKRLYRTLHDRIGDAMGLSSATFEPYIFENLLRARTGESRFGIQV